MLRIFYDYQENEQLFDELSRRAWRPMSGDDYDRWRGDVVHWTRDNLSAAMVAVRRVLTRDEQGIWERIMDPAVPWIVLSYDRLIAPETQDG